MMGLLALSAASISVLMPVLPVLMERSFTNRRRSYKKGWHLRLKLRIQFKEHWKAQIQKTRESLFLIFTLVVNAVYSLIKVAESQLFKVSDKRRNGVYAKNNKR